MIIKHIYTKGMVQSNALDLYILEVLSSDLGRATGYPDWVFCGFYQSLQPAVWIVLTLGHNRFLPNPVQFFIIHLSSCHPSLCLN
jgi:hypothetical protein